MLLGAQLFAPGLIIKLKNKMFPYIFNPVPPKVGAILFYSQQKYQLLEKWTTEKQKYQLYKKMDNLGMKSTF